MNTVVRCSGRLPILFLLVLLEFNGKVFAGSDWPHVLDTKSGYKITIYQPEPESFNNGELNSRAAISVQKKGSEDLIFGAIWSTAQTITDRDNRTVKLESIKITRVKFPDITDTAKINQLKTLLEQEIPKWDLEMSLDQLLTSIDLNNTNGSDKLNTTPPKIYYRKEPTTLILTDGEPKFQKDDKSGMDRVINTAFLIVKNPDDKKNYLYAGSFWYSSSAVVDGWAPVSKLSGTMANIDKQIKDAEKKDKDYVSSKDTKATPTAILVSTTPAELIQSNGEPQMATIEGTNLLYVSNSEDDIFMDISSQKYFVLLSGRWYQSSSLTGTWEYVAPEKLPADFAKIPEGSEKDNVLSSVPGTEAAAEAVADAQMPQTAKVDRATATCTVTYDGEPKFEKIEGTNLYLAQNTSSTVLRSNNKYFCVENGVWFESPNATGPWVVSTERPEDTEKIPAESPAYNVKYVYVYDATPQYVYVGYTPGYMGCYVYGPVVYYGTGYYYNPWYGPYYYPRPYTYGFSMHYNPWTGWSMGFHYSSGFFHFNAYYGGYHGHGGYWGPPMYRPPYHPPHGGYYGPRGGGYGNNSNINNGRTNNVYNYRKDVTTNDVPKGNTNQKPSAGNKQGASNAGQKQTGNSNAQIQGGGKQQGNAGNAAKPAGNAKQPANNVYTDKSGNVYQNNSNGNWQQRDNNQWKDVDRNSNSQVNQLDKQQQQRNTGQQRNNSYNQTNKGGNMGGGMRSSPSGGGGARPSGGARSGGGGRR